MRILAIDDDPAVGLLIKNCGSSLDDCEVVIAPDGRSGMEAARANRPDVILVDAWMPGIDGFEVLATIRSWPAEYRPPRILMMTSDSSGLVEKLAVALGADGVLRKPIGPESWDEAFSRYAGKAKRAPGSAQ